MRKTPDERQRTYREKHRELIRKRQRERYHRTKHLKPKTEERKRYEAEYREANREKMRGYSRKHYAARKQQYSFKRRVKHVLAHPAPRKRRTPEAKRKQLSKASQKYQAKRNLFYWIIKGKFHCNHCGENDPACLEFHHTDPSTKEMNPGASARYASRKRLVAELLKCECLCRNCHKMHHSITRTRKVQAPSIERKRAHFMKIRAASPCSQCGEDRSACIEFHHIDPTTKQFNIGSAAKHVSRRKLLAELEKCIPLCGNCHRRRHYLRDRDYVYDLLTIADIEDASIQADHAFKRHQAS